MRASTRTLALVHVTAVLISCSWLLTAWCSNSNAASWTVTAAPAAISSIITPEAAQQWRTTSDAFDWQQREPNVRVQIVGRGVQDHDGRVYVVGTKSYYDDDTSATATAASPTGALRDQNIFVACIDTDDTIAWTQEFGTDAIDAGSALTLVDEPTSTHALLYVVGTTWGTMDDAAHALNSFGLRGGRDVVLLQLDSSNGTKHWSRQFGSTANDFSYGVTLDATFSSLLLTGGCVVADATSTRADVDVCDVLEARASFARDRTLRTDPRPRMSVSPAHYSFAASFSRNGDLLDFTIDGGVTLTPRRQQIYEATDSAVSTGEYAVVLNRKPLANVTVHADVVALTDPTNLSATIDQLVLLAPATDNDDEPQRSLSLVFTPLNWFIEQRVRVGAIDDAIAEGNHFATITHRTTSLDPHFHGDATPFANGRMVTFAIADNDNAGVALSRTALYTHEGSFVGNDAYDVVLLSRPWFAVTITIVSLDPAQTRVEPTELVFHPSTWHLPQRISVAAVDDALSENEYSGVHSGGALLHYSASLDKRYHTRRPQCVAVVNCDATNASDCYVEDVDDKAAPVRVCDLLPSCAFTLGNGACIANNVASVDDAVPARFGSRVLDPSKRDSVDEDNAALTLTRAAVRALLRAQTNDAAVAAAIRRPRNATAFVAPPIELQGFVWSFLGLLNVEQAQTLARSPRRVLHAACTGLTRLETHAWASSGAWPRGTVDRVLAAVLAMFPEMLDARRLWNCGVSRFVEADGVSSKSSSSRINVTIWDNDLGVTLSTQSLTVQETNDDEDDPTASAAATYTIVLNAPPSAIGASSSLRPTVSMCAQPQTDDCGLWTSSDDSAASFAAVAAQLYATEDDDTTANVSIAIIANAQIVVSPALVTFTTANWFTPQRITVRAVNDDVVEASNATYTITHRVQSQAAAGGYTNLTAFWSAGALPLLRGGAGGGGIPYNPIPTVLYAPQHASINVCVLDNDNAGVDVVVDQPQQRVVSKETFESIDWIGDFASSYAFSDVSVTLTQATNALANVLVFGPHATTFCKFIVPQLHDGDALERATLQLFETPFAIINATTDDADDAGDDARVFTKRYSVRITLVESSWSVDSVRHAFATAAAADEAPQALTFVSLQSIVVTAIVEKRRPIELDVTPLVAQLLPTRLNVAAFRLDVISDASDTAVNTTQSSTQICSSRFARKLRPSLLVAYAFPNLLRHTVATQQSTADLRVATHAVDGDRRRNAATTAATDTPWWQACLDATQRVGQVALFVSETMVDAPLVLIASLQALDASSIDSLDEALVAGCPEACPRTHRVVVKGSGVLLWDVDAGLRCLRVYRNDTGALELLQAEAYDVSVRVTPTTDGLGLRSRLPIDWTPARVSETWRIQQTAAPSIDENVARGMATRQSSTSDERAFASLAVNGELDAAWDATIVQPQAPEAEEAALLLRPGSTRTQLEAAPWWEVDLGTIQPIRAVVLYPYVGMAGRGFCAAEGDSSDTTTTQLFPAWSGDLYTHSRTDPLLMLLDPFVQVFDVLISDTSLADVDATATASIARETTLRFSCANGTRSIAWTDAFTRGRFVTIRKRSSDGSESVLMLNEVQVLRWNPTTTPRYVLLDLYSSHTNAAPLALASIQLFAPTHVTVTRGGTNDRAGRVAAPLPFDIHSVSSQAATSGAGAAAAIMSAATTDCYVAATASTHEWLVLDLGTPTAVGLIEIDANVAACGTGVAAVTAVSIAAHGAALDGMRSASASSALTASPGTCLLDATGARVADDSTALVACTAFVCADAACNAPVRIVGAASTLVRSDFIDVVLLGLVGASASPVQRLPLTTNEHRTLVLRDNPVTLWMFDDLAVVALDSDADITQSQRAIATSVLASSRATLTLVVDSRNEAPFSSSAVVLEPAMPAFSIECWVRFAADPGVNLSREQPVNVVTLGTSGIAAVATIRFTTAHPAGVFTLTDPLTHARCSVALDSVDATLFSVSQCWFHIVATYDPAAAAIALWLSYRSTTTADDRDRLMQQRSARATCSLAMFNVANKTLRFGAYSSNSSTTATTFRGFSGAVASVALYQKALSRAEILDHFHAFGGRSSSAESAATAATHNTYALQLRSKPLTPVHITLRTDDAAQCYRFNSCNATVVPTTLTILPENWRDRTLVHVVATSDALYEGAHTTLVTHVTHSAPTFERLTHVTTPSVLTFDSEHNSSVLSRYTALVDAYYTDLQVTRTLVGAATLRERQQALEALQRDWSVQRSASTLVANAPYNSDAPLSLPIEPLTLHILDATVPGIEFSTTSLVVAEAGRANDYQVVLLSEPTSVTIIAIRVAPHECYRIDDDVDSTQTPRVCRSQTLAATDTAPSTASPMLLCNVTIAPDVLFFSSANWSEPQTVRVVAVDDALDESDVHLTRLETVSTSLDPVYNDLVLPNIVVAVEDNDVSSVTYSTQFVALAEKPGLSQNDPVDGFYTLQLTTEPFADVTIAMRNDADNACYRPCGYALDGKACGLPRTQSVTTIRLQTNATREVQSITLAIPRVVAVQRIVMVVDHVDQIYRIDVVGGFSDDVQVVTFALNDALARHFASTSAVASAAAYGRTFRLRVSTTSDQTVSIDGFATAAVVQAALEQLLVVRDAVRVDRSVRWSDADATAQLQWRITFTRLLDDSMRFPTLSVALDAAFEGAVSVERQSAATTPTGQLMLRYSADDSVDDSEADVATVSVLATAATLERALRDLVRVYAVAVTRAVHATAYGVTYAITFKRVESFGALTIDASAAVAAAAAASNVRVDVIETQAPVRISGTFNVAYTSAHTNSSTQTPPLLWNASDVTVASALSQLDGVGNVSVTQRSLSPEGGNEWIVAFINNNGPMALLVATSLNLTASSNSSDSNRRSVTLAVDDVVTGEALGGSFLVELGGHFKKTDATTQRAAYVDVPRRNTTALAFNASAAAVAHALLLLDVTEQTDVVRIDSDCDAFSVCLSYMWVISYRQSAGDVPPLRVYGLHMTLTGVGVLLTTSTIANGTYVSGSFALALALWDNVTQTQLRGRTWDLPVNVSAIGLDEALEAIPFVRANREAELDPETHTWRGVAFDKGVRVFREGPYLDGGHSWRLEWAIEDYERFQDLEVTIDTQRVTQETEPLLVPTEFTLEGAPRCAAIPTSRFQLDATDPFGLRGACVYDIVAVATQERFLCNFTVVNPSIVFTPANWCQPQRVALVAVDDQLDERSKAHGNITLSRVTHNVQSDDAIYFALALDSVVVQVESDDVAGVVVSEKRLTVREDLEDDARDATYTLTLTTEPLDVVQIVVRPWFDGNQTGCYRFGLCNVTLPVSSFVFTPRNWHVPQTVVVQATDDDLDEDDVHSTGVSHIVYSHDRKYEALAVATIDIRVIDNDASAFLVLNQSVRVTEGGAFDAYDVVLATEPFAKVRVDVTNVGAIGSLTVATPSTLLFTWKDWNVPQRVRVDAVDDATQDVVPSTSVLLHTITSNDAIYAALAHTQPLANVSVTITDNDVAGLALSTHVVNASESNTTVFAYSVRLTSEPWAPVVVRPNATHGCYVRQLTAETLCNVSLLTTALTFDAKNWSTWQRVAFVAVDDWLVEAPVHDARITHSSTSDDPSYDVVDSTDRENDAAVVTVQITDNDVAFVNISLRATGTSNAPLRTQLHVAEGGFNDSYRIVLNSEPLDDVTLVLRPHVASIAGQEESAAAVAQIGVAFQTRASIAATASNGSFSRDVALVFTSVDWHRPRVITVFAIDDLLPEPATHFTSIQHIATSADALYNISNASIGVVSVVVMVNDREAIAPPLPRAATFDATGSRIVVTFDASVFHAESMALRSTLPVTPQAFAAGGAALYAIHRKVFACDLVFNIAAAVFALGRDAQCNWLDFQTLRLALGTGATITVGDVLLLNECASFDGDDHVCTSTTVVRARHTSRAYAQASVAVTAPRDIVTPHVVLLAPEQASSCGTWRIDASLSTGGGGRAFKEVEWSVLPSSFSPTKASSTIVNPDTTVSDASVAQARAVATGLASLCLQYAVDDATRSIAFVPRAELAAALPDVAASSAPLGVTIETLRTACYLQSLAQHATATKAFAVVVDSTQLAPGATYVVGLALTNAFAQRGAAIRTVQVLNSPGPSVFVVGEQNVAVASRVVDEPLVLQVDAIVSCSDVIGTAVGYIWSVTRTSLESDSSSSSGYVPANVRRAATAKDPRVFRVLRTSLDPETSYRFRIVAFMRNDAGVNNKVPYRQQTANSSTTITVNVARSPLVVQIGGGARAIGERDTLVLNSSLTRDPDDAAAPLAFRWSCADVTNTSLAPQPCVNATTTAAASPAIAMDLTTITGAVLSLPPFTLEPSRTLAFTVVVTKTAAAATSRNNNRVTRTATMTTTVWTLPGSVPDVVASITSTSKVSSAMRVALTVRVVSPYPFASRWVQVQGDLADVPLAFDPNTPTHSDAFALPLSSLNNVIQRDKLTPGLTYVFRHVAKDDVNGNEGFAQVSVAVNAPPRAGRLEVTPATGVAIYDTFALTCADWTDDSEDLPLTYAFAALPTQTYDALVAAAATASNRSALTTQLQALATPLVAAQRIPTAAVWMLPPSGRNNNESVTIVAFITDAVGGVAFDAAVITVTLPTDATRDPMAFATHLVALDQQDDDNNGARGGGRRSTYLLLAATVLDRAFRTSADATPSCTNSIAEASLVCSGHGTCDTETLLCVCDSAFIGTECAFAIDAVRDINTAILTQLHATTQAVEASTSELAQQALVVNTVLQASPTTFNDDGRAQIATLSHDIVASAFGLPTDPQAFLASGGASVLEALSTVVRVASSPSTRSNNANKETGGKKQQQQRRRLVASAVASTALSTTALDCSDVDTNESTQATAALVQLIQTLHALAALASQDALREEPAVVLQSPHIRTLAAVGTVLTDRSSGLDVRLTEPAIACLDTDLVVSAFALATPPHSLCSLDGATPLSASTVFAVHSRIALQDAIADAAANSSNNGIQVPVQTLSSASLCVTKAAATLRTAAVARTVSTTRRLATSTDDDDDNDAVATNDSTTPAAKTTTLWQPIVALTLPHLRPLSALEQRNFTTTCHVWNAATSTFEANDVCFKDAAASSAVATVCYCTAIDQLEVLVTLEEHLDYHERSADLYRNDRLSIAPAVTVVVLLSLFVLGSRVGMQMDATDATRRKTKTIQSLNRTKWTELQQRSTHLEPTLLLTEDFATYCATRKQLLPTNSHAAAAAAAARALEPPTDALHSAAVTIADALAPGAAIDAELVLPDETRTLFETNATIDLHWTRLLLVFKSCNVVLAAIGAVVAFVGIDFYVVLGNSTTELLLFVYGKPLGAVLVSCGAALVVVAAVGGWRLARRDANHAARTTYTTVLTLLLVAQLVCVAIACHVVDDFATMPHAMHAALAQQWHALRDATIDEIERHYGCCGFASVDERLACPAEALEAVPPRTCAAVLATQAQTFFTRAFVFAQVVGVVEATCVLFATILVQWRFLRLQQLAGAPASSAAGETTATRTLLQSHATVLLLCVLPSLFSLLSCAAVATIAFGVDLVVQLDWLSNALVAAVYGNEVGAFAIAFAVVYLLVLLRGAVAITTRNAFALRSFVIASFALLVISIGAWQFAYGLNATMQIDATAALEVTKRRFLALPRDTRVALELAMQCCGVDVTTEGTCIVDTVPSIPPCRTAIETIVYEALAVLTTRLLVFCIAQAVVLTLSIVLLVRLWRFRRVTSVSPVITAATTAASVDIDEFQTPFDVRVRTLCTALLLISSAAAALLGFVVVWAGVDAIYELNVLHVAYVLQSIDRHMGTHLVAFGIAIVVVAAAGVWTATTRSHRAFVVLAALSLALFVTGFGALGVAYRSTQPARAHVDLDDDALHFRLQVLWQTAPSTTKRFVQNAFTCCGFDRFVQTTSNNSSSSSSTVMFTDRAEALYWTHEHAQATIQVLAPVTLTPSRRLSADASATDTILTQRVMTQTHVRLSTQTECPHDATIGCSSVLLPYVADVAQYAFQLSIALLAYCATTLASASVLVLRRGKKTPASVVYSSWRVALTRAAVVALAFASVFVALTTLCIGVDIVVGWSLVSSSVLPLLFAASIGVALVAFALLSLLLNGLTLVAATHHNVYWLFFQCVGRAALALAVWIVVGFVGYLSHYSADAGWRTTLRSYLSRRWNMLRPQQQHVVALEYACCGFADPVVVQREGVVWDRPAVGYTCPLSSARGCEHVLVGQITSAFSWLFVYLVALAIAETLLLVLSSQLLAQLARLQREAWFAIESRVRFAIGSFRSVARRRHVALSIVHLYDAKFTRVQRLMCLLCAAVTTLAAFTSYFATHGCYRTALKTCEQPDAWHILVWSFVYGGVGGFVTQTIVRALFERVRNRSDDETVESAIARQRKEKVVLFRSLFQRQKQQQRQPATADSAASTLATAQATTEERWATWLQRFVYQLYHAVAALLFLEASAIATLMALVLVGFSDSLYGVALDVGPRELLLFAVATSATALLAWLAIDLRDRQHRSSSLVAFVAVAIASVLLIAAALVGVFIVFQVVHAADAEEATGDNWSVRKTGFRVVERLENAWNAETTSSFYRNRVQHDLQCCGFRSAVDHAFRPCPAGIQRQVAYEALSVNGTEVERTQTEVRDLEGCLAPMLASFERLATIAAYAAVGLCATLFALSVSAIYLAYDVHCARDAKLKLRVPPPSRASSHKTSTDVRETFARVVGLQIAAPARGKILSHMLATSLDSVAPTIASELAAASLSSASQRFDSASSAAATAARPSRALSTLDADASATVPYPASIVYVVFAVCSVWLATMLWLIVQSAAQLGPTTTAVCLVCWSIGVVTHVFVIEPSVLFVQIVYATLGSWTRASWLVRLVRYGRAALRIEPDAATAAARYYATLSLYERIRYNAAVRIQRRLVTRVTRKRYLQRLRAQQQAAQRALADDRRKTLKQAIDGFTDDEVRAFTLVFDTADVAKLGLVSHKVIAQSIYELGVHVSSDRVASFLAALDPAYADLVDLDHFLYGMHCVRMYHQQLQQAGSSGSSKDDRNNASVGRSDGTVLQEEFVSSSARFGPVADPQSKVVAKRQNVLRELRDKRESLSYKLMSKVSRLPPLLQRGTSSATAAAGAGVGTGVGQAVGPSDAVVAPLDRDRGTNSSIDSTEARPTGAFVILQNRKLTPKKRALETVLKKQHRDDRSKAGGGGGATGSSNAAEQSGSPHKSPLRSPTQRAKAMVHNWKMPSPRAWASSSGTAAARPDRPVDTMINAVVNEEIDSNEATDDPMGKAAPMDREAEATRDAAPQAAPVVASLAVATTTDSSLDDVRNTASSVDADLGSEVRLTTPASSADSTADVFATTAESTQSEASNDSIAAGGAQASSNEESLGADAVVTQSDFAVHNNTDLAMTSDPSVAPPLSSMESAVLRKPTVSGSGKSKILANVLQKKAARQQATIDTSSNTNSENIDVGDADASTASIQQQPLRVSGATTSLEKALKNKKSKGAK